MDSVEPMDTLTDISVIVIILNLPGLFTGIIMGTDIIGNVISMVATLGARDSIEDIDIEARHTIVL